MSEEIDKLKSENQKLNNTLVAFSGQLRARKQMCDELYESNINLRSTSIIQDDQIKILTNQVKELNEKINELEKIKLNESLPSLD